MIQQIFKEMNKCKLCNKETKNKIYCSTSCQHNGYKELKIARIECVCLYCNNMFETLQNKIDNGKKYCSRGCKDKHQKELYLKEGNPVYGIKHSNEWKSEASVRVKDLWNTEEFRNKVTLGQNKFFEENGFWNGTDTKSLTKKIETNLERYGVECILSLKEYRDLSDKICLEKYGKTAFELMLLANKNKQGTNIEQKIVKILIDNDIKFETQFDVFYNDKKYKIYDFYLKEFNLLIEADGDYWHSNPNKFIELNEVQLINKTNDKFKNKLAEEKGFNLIRFWETDIKKKNFKFKLLNEIKKYGKKEN